MEYQTTEPDDILEHPQQLPGMLNTLTILTLIGCGLAYLSSFYSFYTASNYEEQMAKMREAQDKLGDSGMGKWVEGSMDMLQRTHEYRYVILATGLVFTTLCLIGALQMRKLKKSGFILYTIGELTPFIITAILIGLSFTSGIAMAFGLIIAIVFVILYATQRKYLVNN